MSYVGNTPQYAAFITDTFNGNNSTVAFTMSVAPANTASIIVAVTGVLQDPSTYSVNGLTLTFSQAPPTGTGNISVRYLGIPASGITNTAYRTITEFTATSGQTTFATPSYTVGYINVYINGVRMASSDFTATSGTTVVMASPTFLNDIVVTESFYVSSVLNALSTNGGVINGSLTTAGTATFNSTVTHSAGTANGVAYLNGSKALTTGSALVFDGSNLGLGVTPSAWSIGTAIQVKRASFYTYDNSGVEISQNAAVISGAWQRIGADFATKYAQDTGKHYWFTAPSSTAGSAITWTQAMTLDASGNLGLGTTAPQNKLQVKTTVRPQLSVSYDGTTGLYLEDSTASVGKSWKIATSTAVASALEFYQSTATSGVPVWAATAAMTLDASGNLLVGTTTKNNDGKISISASSALNQGMTIRETSTTNDIYYILFQNSTGGTAGRIEHTGATTVNYTSGSDVRLKTNIVDAGSAKEKIESIKIREFDWITGEHQKFGVIAQELIEVAPEAVCAARTENDYWGVDYSKLVPSLIKYVQEQQALITQLQTDVAALKGVQT